MRSEKKINTGNLPYSWRWWQNSFVIITFGFFFSFLCCRKKIKVGTPYFPLRLNKSYEYDFWVVDEEEDTLESGEMIISFVGKNAHGKDEQYQVMVCFIADGDTTRDSLYFEEKEFAIFEYDSLDAVPDTFLSLPLAEGKSWRYEPFWHRLVSIKRNVRVKKEEDFVAENRGKDEVVVKAGRFNDVYKIEYSAEDILGDFYLARDVGLVKFSEREGDPESYSWFIWELRKPSTYSQKPNSIKGECE